MENAIIALEERLRMAMLNSDVTVLDRLISDKLLFTNHLGHFVSKEEDLHSHATKRFVFHSIELLEQTIVPLDGVASESAKVDIKGEYQGQAANGIFRFTRVWSPCSGEWQVITAHSTLIK